MKRLEPPDSISAFLALSREEKELWAMIDKAETKLREILEKRRKKEPA